jgi:hypothetical protein
MIFFNWLAAVGYLGGTTTAAISQKHPTVITPAGYAFTIWTLIYLGLVVFSIRQMFPAYGLFARKIRSLFIFSCALNCAWLYFWHQDQIAICAAIIWVLCLTLFQINRKLADRGEPEAGLLIKAFTSAGWP